MAYLRCTECGSKALVAASQCPRCAHPFALHDARGSRVKLTRCRGCSIMHRIDTPCHWCGEIKPAFRVPANALRSAAAVALLLSAAAGVWRYGPALRDAAGNLGQALATVDAPRFTVAENSLPASTLPAPLASVAPSLADSALYEGAESGALVAADDSIQWTPAVARTWVNVRSDASRGGEVVGVIKPASRAMLGTDRAGWRQVRSTDVSGWVDPRLFERDSLRTRGE